MAKKKIRSYYLYGYFVSYDKGEKRMIKISGTFNFELGIYKYYLTEDNNSKEQIIFDVKLIEGKSLSFKIKNKVGLSPSFKLSYRENLSDYYYFSDSKNFEISIDFIDVQMRNLGSLIQLKR